MLKGLWWPYTKKGESSILPELPWHYSGNIMALEYEADERSLQNFVPDFAELNGNRCSVSFIDWQTSAGSGNGYLDPVRSQYQEALILMSIKVNGKEYAYCPYIWVSSELALYRGLLQGWPKQLGSVGLTRLYPVAGQAAPVIGPGAQLAGSCTAKDNRIMDLGIELEEKTNELPSPFFANAYCTLQLPDLTNGINRDGENLLDLHCMACNSDIKFGEVWKGKGNLRIHTDYYKEMELIKPVKIGNAYFFGMCFTLNGIKYEPISG